MATKDGLLFILVHIITCNAHLAAETRDALDRKSDVSGEIKADRRAAVIFFGVSYEVRPCFNRALLFNQGGTCTLNCCLRDMPGDEENLRLSKSDRFFFQDGKKFRQIDSNPGVGMGECECRPSTAADYYNTSVQSTRIVDFRTSIPNYESQIFSPLRDSGFQTDVFFATNLVGDDTPDVARHMNRTNMTAEILKAYKPVKYIFQRDADPPKARPSKEQGEMRLDRLSKSPSWPSFSEETALHEQGRRTSTEELEATQRRASLSAWHSRQQRLEAALQLCIDHQNGTGQLYERVIVTRFDMLFQHDLLQRIDWNKINLASHLTPVSGYPRIDDNFYALKGSMLEKFQAVVRFGPNYEKNFDTGHYILPRLEQVAPVHFLEKEDATDIYYLNSYKIARLCYVESIRNEHDERDIPAPGMVDLTYVKEKVCSLVDKKLCSSTCLRNEAYQQFISHRAQNKSRSSWSSKTSAKDDWFLSFENVSWQRTAASAQGEALDRKSVV